MTYVVLGVLLVLSACFSGLNLGMMSLSPNDLKRKAQMGDKRAKKIYTVRKKGNLLLVTLLLGNVAVNAAIAIFMGSIASGFLAGLVTTFLITIFGEIGPQAIFSRFALSVGAKVVWLVRLFIFILYPVAAPIAFILDKALGAELPTIYSRHELREIISEHLDSSDSDIGEEEANIARGAFTFGDKKVKEVMVPRSKVLSLHSKDILDQKTIQIIGKNSFPRIPVMGEKEFIIEGIVYTYDLLKRSNFNKRASDISHKKIIFVNEDEKLDSVLNKFIQKKHHMFIVVNEFKEYSGIITIEDILEDILGKEIVDEFDIDNSIT